MASLFPDAELGAPPGGIGYYPGIVQRGGDAWFNVDQPRFNNVQVGDSAYYVVLHELGHTVGLKHGHANDRPGPTMDLLPDDVDSFEFSVMTYHHYIGAPDVPVAGDTPNGSFPQSLMMYDIAAIQYMYGANFNYNSGNTVYTFSPTTGEMFVNGVGQGTPEDNHIFRTIWDGNGVDTYDLSNYTTDLRDRSRSRRLVQLPQRSARPSEHRQRHLRARQRVQRAAVRGRHAFTHRECDRRKRGRYDPRQQREQCSHRQRRCRLADRIGGQRPAGGRGGRHPLRRGRDDVLEGGVGGDELSGGAGFDFASYEHAAAGVYASLTSPALNSGEAFHDMYISIEGLIGSVHNDTLIGNGSANTLRGGRGNDTLSGLGGADILDGGAGNDSLRGGAGNDTFLFTGGIGHDTIVDWQDGPWFLAHDYISFQGMGLSMADLSITYSGGNAIVSVAALHGDITILSAPVGSIGADDFLF